MPQARLTALPKLAVLTALTAALFATTTGIASADTSPPDGSTTTVTPSDPTSPTTDPGTTDPTDPTQSTDPTTTVVDPTITFTLPQASAHARYDRALVLRRQWHHRAVHAVIAEVRKQLGKPYVYGADGPGAFDCSGLVRYVFGHAVGRWLPHNAAAQYDVIRHIKRSDLEPGDLVFQESGGYPFHVGIYAGHDKWWHAPHSGDHVRKQKIYRGHLYYGRVLVWHAAKRHAHRRHR